MNSVAQSVRGRARNKTTCSEDEPNNKKQAPGDLKGGRRRILLKFLVV